jgi:hypothetical protein
MTLAAVSGVTMISVLRKTARMSNRCCCEPLASGKVLFDDMLAMEYSFQLTPLCFGEFVLIASPTD